MLPRPISQWGTWKRFMKMARVISSAGFQMAVYCRCRGVTPGDGRGWGKTCGENEGAWIGWPKAKEPGLLDRGAWKKRL